MTEPTPMIAEDRVALERAFEALEHPSLAARTASVVGRPVAELLDLLPRRWHDAMGSAAEAAIGRALSVALSTLGNGPSAPTRDRENRLFAALSGAVGGFLGLPALVVELPLVTVLMLRSIADVARGHGEDLEAIEPRLACVTVFAIGGRSPGDTYAEIGYYEVRAALAIHFTPLAGAVSDHGGGALALPAAVNLVRGIAARFGVVLSDKAAAQLVPALGAAAGAALNYIFMRHFQDVADGHFTVRRLERRYGRDAVEAVYREIASREAGPSAAVPSLGPAP